MCRCCIVLCQIEVLSEAIEWLRLVKEEVNSKDAFGLGQVVLLKVVVDTGAWGTEVGDASRYGHSCTCHHHDVLEFVRLESIY